MCIRDRVISLFVYKQLSLKDLGRVMLGSAKTSAMIMFIIANGILFTFVLTSERIPGQVTDAMLEMDLNKYMFLLIINVLLLIVGAFMAVSYTHLTLPTILRV